MTHYLIDNQPEEWEQLAAIYDKDGEYKKQYIELKMRGPNASVTNAENDETEEKAETEPNAENKPE